MIAKFRPAGRVAFLLSAMLTCAICCFTFTRAAEKRPELERRDKTVRETRSVDDGKQRDDADSLRTPSFKKIKQKLDELDQRIRKAELKVDELRQKILIPSQVADGDVEGRFALETIRRLEASRIEVDSKFRGLSKLLDKLKELRAEGSDKLRKAMLTVHYDPQLGKLLEDLWTTETTLAKLKETMGRDHPEFRSVSAMRDNLDKRVDERIEGILSGLQAQAAANKAQLDSMANAVDDAKRRDAESAATYRPYFQAKRDLESLQRVRDALYLKLLEQEYGVEVLKAKTQDQ